MFALRQQVVRKAVQRVAQRSMGSHASGPIVVPNGVIANRRLPPELNLPWTAEQQAGLEAFSKEFRARHQKQVRQPVHNPKYQPYTDAELLRAAPIPKYSRDFVNIFGLKREARVYWLFPMYYTVAVVGSTYALEYLGDDIFIRPFLALLPPPKTEV